MGTKSRRCVEVYPLATAPGKWAFCEWDGPTLGYVSKPCSEPVAREGAAMLAKERGLRVFDSSEGRGRDSGCNGET